MSVNWVLSHPFHRWRDCSPEKGMSSPRGYSEGQGSWEPRCACVCVRALCPSSPGKERGGARGWAFHPGVGMPQQQGRVPAGSIQWVRLPAKSKSPVLLFWKVLMLRSSLPLHLPGLSRQGNQAYPPHTHTHAIRGHRLLDLQH